MGIGGGTLMFGSKGFFPRPRSLGGMDKTLEGGVMYLRAPSPSHLRYPEKSYKTLIEEGKNNGEETRWGLINDMAKKYEEEVAKETMDEIEGLS